MSMASSTPLRAHEPLVDVIEDLLINLGEGNLKDNARKHRASGVGEREQGIWLLGERGRRWRWWPGRGG